MAKLRLPEHEGIIMGVTATPSPPSGALFSHQTCLKPQTDRFWFLSVFWSIKFVIPSIMAGYREGPIAANQ